MFILHRESYKPCRNFISACNVFIFAEYLGSAGKSYELQPISTSPRTDAWSASPHSSAGWSDKVFDVLNAVENGADVLDMIRNTEDY